MSTQGGREGGKGGREEEDEGSIRIMGFNTGRFKQDIRILTVTNK